MCTEKHVLVKKMFMNRLNCFKKVEIVSKILTDQNTPEMVDSVKALKMSALTEDSYLFVTITSRSTLIQLKHSK